MAFLTREQILVSTDRKFVELEVPEWGGTLRLGEMTGAQRDAYELEVGKAQDGETELSLRAALVGRCIVNEEGIPVFHPNDIKALGEKSAQALHRVFKAAVKLNGLGKEAEETASKNS